MTAIPRTPDPGASSGNPAAVPPGHDSFTPQERELFEAICRYALSEDRDDLAVVGGLYVAYARATPIARRLQLLDAVTVGVGDGTIPVRAYHPFLFHDSQARVIAEATSRVSVQAIGAPGDPLYGAREMSGYAREMARRGDEARAIGMFAGVVVLGASPAVHCAGPCWRSLTPEGRFRLARLLRRQATPAISGWLAEWMEECAGREFVEVARTVAALPRNAREHPLLPAEIEIADQGWDHRLAYAGFTEWRDSLDLEREEPHTLAISVAGEILLSQLDVVTLQLADRGAGLTAMHAVIHAAIRRPWALGYVLGVAHATLGASGVASGDDGFTDAVTSVHLQAYGRVASADMIHLSRTAQRSPDFALGATAGREDAESFCDGADRVVGLAAWLSQRLIGGDAHR